MPARPDWRVRLDWPGHHGPVIGPAHAVSALTCAAAVATLPAVEVDPWWVMAVGAFGAGAVYWREARTDAPWIVPASRAALWLGAVAWLTYVLVNGWSTTALLALVAVATLAGMLARPIAARSRAVVAQRERAREMAAADYADRVERDRLYSLVEHWIARIHKICGVRCEVPGEVPAIEPWMHPGPDGKPRQTGYTIELKLPRTGVTRNDIAAHVTGLATAEDLPDGCGIEVRPGVSRLRFLLEVNTVDALRDDIPLPLGTEPRSIYDDLDIGVTRNGSKALVNLRYDGMTLVGATGSGKSNEIQTVSARLVECCDTLILVIDKNGGGLAIPWLRPWATGEIDVPPIWWVADTEDEADLMTRWLVEMIGARKRSQSGVMLAAGDDKVAVSGRVPQLVLVTDEAGSLPTRLQDRVTDISDRGRGSGIRTVTCGLRATADYLPTALRAQAAVRVAMRCNDQRELDYYYDWGCAADAADAPLPGYGHVGVQGQAPYVHKGYRTAPGTIRRVALASARWRPAEVEPETLAELPEELRRIGMERWKRTDHIRRAAAGGEPARPAESRPVGPPPGAPHPGGMRGALDDLADKRRRLEEAMEGAPPEPQADDGPTFEEITKGLVVLPELIIRVLAAMGDAERMHTADIAKALGVSVFSLGGMLSQVDLRPLKNAFDLDGKAARGYALADVEAVAARISSGELAVPEDVARWRPGSA